MFSLDADSQRMFSGEIINEGVELKVPLALVLPCLCARLSVLVDVDYNLHK